MPRANKVPKPVQIVQAVQSPGSSPGSVQSVIQSNTEEPAVRDDRGSEAYGGKFTGKIEALRVQNTFFWDESVDDATI